MYHIISTHAYHHSSTPHYKNETPGGVFADITNVILLVFQPVGGCNSISNEISRRTDVPLTVRAAIIFPFLRVYENIGNSYADRMFGNR